MWVKACVNTEVKIEPSNKLTQYGNRAIRKEDTSALTYLDNTSIENEPIDGTNKEELPNQTHYSSKGKDQSKVNIHSASVVEQG